MNSRHTTRSKHKITRFLRFPQPLLMMRDGKDQYFMIRNLLWGKFLCRGVIIIVSHIGGELNLIHVSGLPFENQSESFLYFGEHWKGKFNVRATGGIELSMIS
jgi:hypothetical protein